MRFSATSDRLFINIRSGASVSQLSSLAARASGRDSPLLTLSGARHSKYDLIIIGLLSPNNALYQLSGTAAAPLLQIRIGDIYLSIQVVNKNRVNKMMYNLLYCVSNHVFRQQSAQEIVPVAGSATRGKVSGVRNTRDQLYDE